MLFYIFVKNILLKAQNSINTLWVKEILRSAEHNF